MNMRIYLLFFSLIFIIFPSLGQVILLDSVNNTPIAFAHVISDRGDLVATSNLNGYIQLDSTRYFNNHTFVIQHLSYINIEIACEKICGKDTVFMYSKNHILQEVNVGSNQLSVAVLRGYYRSYELDNNTPKFYTDGIVEYYIPIAKEKKIKMKLIEYRAYVNNILVEQEKQRTNTVLMRLAGIPRIEYNSALEAVRGNEYSASGIGESTMEIRKDTFVVGTIKQNSGKNEIQINIDFLTPNKNKTKKLFNYISQIVNNQLIEIYPNVELSELSLKDILRREKHRIIFFKHKDDSAFVKLEGVDELYIFGRSYISKKEFKQIKSSSYYFPESCSYKNEYWKDIDKYNISTTNINIENAIETILTKAHNTQ